MIVADDQLIALMEPGRRGKRSRREGDRSSLRVTPIPMRPGGASGSKRCVTGVDAQAQVRSHPPRRRIHPTKADYSWILSSLIFESIPVSFGAVMLPRARRQPSPLSPVQRSKGRGFTYKQVGSAGDSS
jgi:hypothetical protein